MPVTHFRGAFEVQICWRETEAQKGAEIRMKICYKDTIMRSNISWQSVNWNKTKRTHTKNESNVGNYTTVTWEWIAFKRSQFDTIGLYIYIFLFHRLHLFFFFLPRRWRKSNRRNRTKKKGTNKLNWTIRKRIWSE